jgi:hypothetical protein
MPKNFISISKRIKCFEGLGIRVMVFNSNEAPPLMVSCNKDYYEW